MIDFDVNAGNVVPSVPTDTTEPKLDTATLAALRRFIGPTQMAAIQIGLRGEEAVFFVGKMIEYAERIAAMPKTYETDGQGDQATAHLHYFTAACDWYITEKDSEDVQHQAFGLASIHEDELGYISIVELLRCRAELDLHFTPTTLATIRQRRA